MLILTILQGDQSKVTKITEKRTFFMYLFTPFYFYSDRTITRPIDSSKIKISALF